MPSKKKTTNIFDETAELIFCLEVGQYSIEVERSENSNIGRDVFFFSENFKIFTSSNLSFCRISTLIFLRSSAPFAKRKGNSTIERHLWI